MTSMAGRDGTMILHGNFGGAHCRARVCGGEVPGAHVRTARFGRFSFPYPVDVVVCTDCRMRCRSGHRRGALRSGQLDLVLGELPGTAGEPGSFWDRLHEAWRVLLGTPTEAEVTKNRFGNLLVRDRGFNSTNLSRLYNAAKGAITQHVELEHDGDPVVTAAVDRLGELRLDFRVRRVKSVLLDEPFSDSHLLDMESSMGISEHRLWEDTRMIQDLEVQAGSSSKVISNYDAQPESESPSLCERDVGQDTTAQVDSELGKHL